MIHFSLDFSIIQITSQRAVVELNSLDVNLFHANSTLHLIYSLTDSISLQPILRGTIRQLPTKKTPHNSTHLVLEGLKPSTNHSLQIYIQANFNPAATKPTTTGHSFVFLYTTRAFTTLAKPSKPARPPSSAHSKQSAFQIIKKKLSKSPGNVDYPSDEYDYDDDDMDYDDTYDYYDPASTSSVESVINCQTDLMDTANQLITINYLPANANKLLKALLNRTGQLMEFKTYAAGFFQLNNLARTGLDYATYSDCSKQVNADNLVLSKPLCLFNIAAMWQPLLRNDRSLSDEIFAVQTSIKTQQNSFVYIAATCLNKHQSTTTTSTTTTVTTPISNTTTAAVASTTPKAKGQMFQSLFSNAKIYQLKTPNISQCLVLNDNELQFRIEHSSVGLKYMTSSQPVLVYYIEFESSDLRANSLAYANSDELDEETSKKFFIKKEKDVQVVTINFIRGNYKIPQESLLSPISGVNLKQKVRSKRTLDSSGNISKSEPYVLATHVELMNDDDYEKEASKTAVFRIKIKLFSESSSHSSNFTEISVDCRHVYNGRNTCKNQR